MYSQSGTAKIKEMESENPAVALKNLQLRHAEARLPGNLPKPMSRQLTVDDMGPVAGRMMSFETGLADGSSSWAIELQNLLNRNNPNVGNGLQPYNDMKDALQKKYPGAFFTGDFAGMAGSGYLYGVPSAAEDAANLALRGVEELGSPEKLALDKAADKLLAQKLRQGYTQGGSRAVGDALENGAAAFGKGSEGAGSNVIARTRVGQWMTKTEYEQFVKTGEIPRTNVLVKGMDGYIQQANKGDFYVEFDIDPSLLVPKNEALGWSLIKSKNQMYRKLYQNKGLTLPEPTGTNITHIYTK